jgi:hypothetical protein
MNTTFSRIPRDDFAIANSPDTLTPTMEKAPRVI